MEQSNLDDERSPSAASIFLSGERRKKLIEVSGRRHGHLLQCPILLHQLGFPVPIHNPPSRGSGMVSRYWLKPAALMSYGLFVSRRTRGEVTSCLAVPLTGLDGGERQRGDRG